MLNVKKTIVALSVGLALALPTLADEANGPGAETSTDTEQAQARQSVDPAIAEAVNAINETQKAIAALDEERKDDAIAALERGIGKLEIVLAQNPRLALAPFDVTSEIIDTSATPEGIRQAREHARTLLNEGKLQAARAIIVNLASEVDIHTSYLPLETYPVALKAAAALIKTDKIEDAKLVLSQALNTLVVADTIVPLPLLRAGVLIDKARALSEKEDRTDAENAQLSDLLDSIDLEIARGEELQYGGPGAFDPIKDEMNQVRAKTDNGGFGQNIMSKLKDLFGAFAGSSSTEAKNATN